MADGNPQFAEAERLADQLMAQINDHGGNLQLGDAAMFAVLRALLGLTYEIRQMRLGGRA